MWFNEPIDSISEDVITIKSSTQNYFPTLIGSNNTLYGITNFIAKSNTTANEI